MKQTAFLLTLLILITAALSSCSRDSSVDSALLDKAEDAAKVPALPPKAEEYMGDWLPETVYSSGALSEIEGMRYNRANDRAADSAADGVRYARVQTFQTFPNPEGGTNKGTVDMMRLVDLATGEDRPLCPDPLCRHVPYQCPYVELSPVGSHGGALYVIRFDHRTESAGDSTKLYMIQTVERVDPATGEFTEIVRVGERYPTEEKLEMLTQSFFDGNRMLCGVMTEETDRENKTAKRSSVYRLVDLDTGELIREYAVPEEWENALFSVSWMDEDGFYCSDQANGFYRLDMNFENMEKIGEGTDCERIAVNAVDTQTGEVFVDLYNPRTGIQLETYRLQTKRLGKIVGGEIEEIPLPRNDLIEVQVTRNWIYYTAADFIPVGLSHSGHGEIGFEDGGVIYRVPREHPDAEPEIVFSEGADFCMKDVWFVIGDCLYFESCSLEDEGGSKEFGLYVKTVRLNLKDHTVRYFRYD
ncbi:MAG: hypothetical protein IKQ92_03270 [Clostridia bacterium]|nr:hypothetical protein [Clostridia bacterium]